MGRLKTFSFTPVLFPVYDHVNDDFGNNYKLNVAGRFYFLLYDTDIDLMFMTGGSRTDRYGVDFSRNITTNFEVHGELAYIRNFQKNVLDASGNRYQVEGDAVSYLIGIRHLTSFDLTTIIEYYHNGTGFSGDDMKNYYAYITRGYNTYQTTGNATILGNAQQMAEGGYGRSNAMANYLYVRFSQKEPFDILYFTPALTVDDEHGRPELVTDAGTALYRLHQLGISPPHRHYCRQRNSDFGEKQNDYRIELRVRVLLLTHTCSGDKMNLILKALLDESWMCS